MKFEEIFGYEVIKNYLKERKYKAFFGELLFPSEKIEDIDLAYIKGANNIPISASVHGFDTESEIDSRETLEYIKQRLALIKRKRKLGEELILKLNSPRSNREFEKAKELVFNDVDDMVMSVMTRVEAMRMEAITTGKITVNENGANITLDYGVPSSNIKTQGGSSAWTHADSDPIKDIYDWTNFLVETTGTKPTRAITSNTVLSTLISNAKVRKAIFGSDNSKMLSKKTINEFLESQDLPIVATYDDRYKVQGNNGKYVTKRFFDENKFVMLPSEQLGETIFGLTPEEIELKGKEGNEISEDNNITVQIYRTQDPVARWTKAVATALPSFPCAGEILIATVK